MKLSLLCIFRNEEHGIEEFIDHYIQQGIDHFYMIDNASEDNSRKLLEKYSDIVTIKEEPFVGPTEVLTTGGRQVQSYNEFLPKIETDWLYVCDLDEYAYARNGYKTIREFIEKNQDKANQFLIPLKTFTSSGLIQQPKSIVDGFTKRWYNEKYHLYKPIAKKDSIRKIGINHCFLKEGITTNTSMTLFSEGFTTEELRIDKDLMLEFRLQTNGRFENSCILSNHYQTQSKEWYYKVKATRGTATWHGGVSMPAIDWFNHMWTRAHKREQVDDFELINFKRDLHAWNSQTNSTKIITRNIIKKETEEQV